MLEGCSDVEGRSSKSFGRRPESVRSRLSALSRFKHNKWTFARRSSRQLLLTALPYSIGGSDGAPSAACFVNVRFACTVRIAYGTREPLIQSPPTRKPFRQQRRCLVIGASLFVDTEKKNMTGFRRVGSVGKMAWAGSEVTKRPLAQVVPQTLASDVTWV